MIKKQLSEIKKGEYIKLVFKGGPANTIWVRGHYDRATKSYSLYDFENVNREIFRKKSTSVFTDFDF
jgi:hypothetical protein